VPLFLLAPFLVAAFAASAQGQPKTTHVIFVMTDGLRWQEVFQGAEVGIMNKKNGNVSNEAALKKTYWRETSEARRKALLPFVWSVMAQQGQLFGNRKKVRMLTLRTVSSSAIPATAKHSADFRTTAWLATRKFSTQM
jgi:hypothetical protein